MDNKSLEIPDFSGDDFVNDKEIQKTRQAVEKERKVIEDSMTIIQNELNVKKSSHKNLKSFGMFKTLQPILISSFSSTNSSLTISIAEYYSSYSTPKNPNSGSDKYLFGHLQLKRMFPTTYICKETIKEKIADLFLKIDTDFTEHKKFSRKFHVLTQDKDKLTSMLQFKNLDSLITFPDMEIEIINNACLFRNSRRRISPDEATRFSSLAKTLSSILN
jgi:hypothetical protein